MMEGVYKKFQEEHGLGQRQARGAFSVTTRCAARAQARCEDRHDAGA
ncbi:MAG: hypothetical protein MZV65_52895 [Chromatiales bacterium]|nr:hypothetical protein [Chromatiales bacterium]